jgi:hypothetical protein
LKVLGQSLGVYPLLPVGNHVAQDSKLLKQGLVHADSLLLGLRHVIPLSPNSS